MAAVTVQAAAVSPIVTGDPPEVTSWNFVGTRASDPSYPVHTHESDQLCWYPGGALEVGAGGERWVVPSDGALWVPAGVPHEVRLLGAGYTLNLYAHPGLRPAGARWQRALTVRLDPLAGAIVRHLSAGDVTPALRRHAHGLLVELLAAAPEHRATVPVPHDARARAVAEQLLRDPADPRDVTGWAAHAGVSARTLMRLFASETGRTFGDWRTRVRVHAAQGLLSDGEPVHAVAPAVGYRTVSGFIEAFKGVVGTTPAAYQRSRRPAGEGRAHGGFVGSPG
ncbi:helix-turn-helix domain-containing protein [Cellulosimicrobium sp. NPDC057862]|uniref:helix-turn-helix domain-containing protein n=1 Tax=Cellulosimicrobium sp. NPDC057862 TaxID=3346266 RepID=UPI00366C5466